MPTILLARHAQGSFGGEDYDVLSKTGHAQAEALAIDLVRRGVELDRVVSGTLARQRDTALPTAERYGRGLEVDARWNEYESDELIAQHADPAAAPATTREFQALLDQALLDWVGDDSETGSWPGFRDRVDAALGELARSLGSGECALVCTSGGPIAAASLALLGVPPAALVALNRVLVNGGLSKIVAGRAGTTLVSFNEHAYLERPGRSLVTYR